MAKTKTEIKTELDALGIEYTEELLKEELEALLKEAKAADSSTKEKPEPLYDGIKFSNGAFEVRGRRFSSPLNAAIFNARMKAKEESESV